LPDDTALIRRPPTRASPAPHDLHPGDQQAHEADPDEDVGHGAANDVAEAATVAPQARHHEQVHMPTGGVI
jgi:hypothetical protein